MSINHRLAEEDFRHGKGLRHVPQGISAVRELVRLVGPSVLAGDGRCCGVQGSRAGYGLGVNRIVVVRASHPDGENPVPWNVF